MDEKYQTNFYKIFIYILEFLVIFLEFFPNFSASKTIYLNILRVFLHFGALSRPVGIFSVFLGFFWHFSEFSSI